MNYEWKGDLQEAAVAAGAGKLFVVKGREAITFQVEGIDGDTITWQGTINGSDWVSIKCTSATTGTSAATAAADGIYHVDNPNLVAVRANITDYSAGTINVEALAR